MDSPADERRALPLQPRSIIANRYEVLKCLGVGSLGTVYLCRTVGEDLSRSIKEGQEPVSKTSSRLVALKELAPIFSSTPEGATALARFRNEVAVLLRVRHPHVIQIFEYLNDPPHTAYAMEYVEGGDLGSYLRAHPPLPLAHVIRLLSEICSGVDAIRSAGIVHRDLKPSNILLTEEGTAKIADFGIARAEDGPRLTARGGVVGTIEYMSPEYLEHGEISPHGDVYSVGVIGYEMLAGRTPYAGMGMLKTVEQKLSADPIAPSARAPHVPGWLDGILLRALSRDPTKRFTTTAEMKLALDEGMRQLTPEDRAAAREWSHIPAARTHTSKFENAEIISLASPAPLPRRRPHLARVGLGGMALGILGFIAIALGTRVAPLPGNSPLSLAGRLTNENHISSPDEVRDESFARLELPTTGFEPPAGVLQPVIVEGMPIPPESRLPLIRAASPRTNSSAPTHVLSPPVVSGLVKGHGPVAPPVGSTERVPPSSPSKIVSAPRSEEKIVRAAEGEADPLRQWRVAPAVIADPPTEFKVRATLLYRLADYIAWPPESFTAEGEPLRVCIVGRDPFGAHLDTVLASSRHRSGRAYEAVRLRADTPADALTACHLLYAVKLPASQIESLRAAVSHRPVLLITDTPGGGMIDFVLRDQKVKFMINERRMKSAGLAPAPVLLDLAVSQGG